MLSGDNKPLTSEARGELFDQQVTQLSFTALDGCNPQQIDELKDLFVTITLVNWLTNQSQGLPEKKRNRIEYVLIGRLGNILNQPGALAEDLKLEKNAGFTLRLQELVNELAMIATTEHVSSHFKLLCAQMCLKFPNLLPENKTFWQEVELQNQLKHQAKIGHSIFSEEGGKKSKVSKVNKSVKSDQADQNSAPTPSKKRKLK